MLMTTLQLSGTEAYESKMTIYTSTTNTNTGLARYFQKNYQAQHKNMDCCITIVTENVPVKGSRLIMSIMSFTSNMGHIRQLKFHVLQLTSRHCHLAVCTQNLME